MIRQSSLSQAVVWRASGVLPWACGLTLWAAAFVLSCRLTGVAWGTDGSPGREGSVGAALLGESRVALSGHFYEMADEYFHKGVEHTREKAFHGDWLQTLRDEIVPARHAHLHGEEVREMMPWLWLAIEMNPARVETYLVAAFWLAHDGGYPDLAVEVLRRGQCSIPRDYEIQLEKGRILLRMGRTDQARSAFDAGLAFWPGGRPAGEADAQRDRASLLLYRALTYEARDERRRAIADLEEILRMLPERSSIRERIAELRQGGQPALRASSVWAGLLKADAAARMDKTCPRDEDPDHDHEH